MINIDLTDGIKDLSSSISTYRQLGKDSDSLILLLYLECIYNIDLVNSLKLDIDKKIKSYDPDILLVITKLEYKYLQTLFHFGKKSQKALAKLKKEVLIQVIEDDENEEPYEKKVKIMPSLPLYLLRKIKIAKILALMDRKGNSFKKTMFRHRLININQVNYALIKILEEHKFVKKFKNEFNMMDVVKNKQPIKIRTHKSKT